MRDPALLFSTQHPKVDEILQGIVGLYELVFPDLIRGYYLTGSFADGSAVATSDIDLYIVFKGRWLDDQKQRAWALRNYCWALTSADLDLTLLDEEQLSQHYTVNLKLSSAHIYGEDVRAQLPLTPLDQYVANMMHTPFRLIARVREDSPTLTFPLDYPDSQAEFYGYTRRKFRSLEGGQAPGLKEIVGIVGLIASAVVAQAARTYVVRKADGLRLYREHIHDEWTGLVEEVYDQCRTRWQYLVPETAVEREQLRALCGRVLAFENHYLARYRNHLLGELSSGDVDIKRFAVRRLGQMVYSDSEVVAALTALQDADDELQETIAETLGKIQAVTSQRTITS